MKKTTALFIVLIIVFLLHIATMVLFFAYDKTGIPPVVNQEKSKTIQVIQLPKKKTKYIPPAAKPGKYMPVKQKKPVLKKTKSTPEKESPPKHESTKWDQTQKAPINSRQKAALKKNKPTLQSMIGTMNPYIFQDGNGLMRSIGERRKANEFDILYMNYQEKIKKQFIDTLNHYLDKTFFYNIGHAKAFVEFSINQDGKLLHVSTQNLSNNPAIPSLLEKVVRYAEPFPRIPKALGLKEFIPSKIGVDIYKGKLSGNFAWR